MRTTRFAPTAALIAITVSQLFACASWGNREKGAVVGAAAGAGVGAVIGNQTGSTARGAIIGAVVGGAAGAVIGHQMDQQAKEIQQNIPGATVTRIGEGLAVTFASGLLYDFDSDAVKPTARTNLLSLSQSLDKYPGSDLLILGHTDSVGTDDYNKRLSVRRADAAAEYLVGQGVDRSRIATGGLGEEEPIAPNDTPDGRSRNRRVEVAIYASEKLREEARARAGS